MKTKHVLGSPEMCEAVRHSISMRMNYIETGDVSLSASDAEAINKDCIHRDSKIKIKALSKEQRDLLNLLDEARKRLS